MVLWHNVLDVATLNADTNFTAQHPGYMGGVTDARRLFIEELGKELIVPHTKRRMEGTPHLQKHITGAMERCMEKTNTATTQLPKTEKPAAGVPSATALCARSTHM